MNEHDATEQAFLNGYNAGVRELAERLKLHSYIISDESQTGIVCRYSVVTVAQIDTIANELIVNYESSKNEKQRKEDENEQRGF